MKEVAVYDEAKTRFSELLAAMEKGEQFVITRRGEAVAGLVTTAPAAESTRTSWGKSGMCVRGTRRAEAAARRHYSGHAATAGDRAGARLNMPFGIDNSVVSGCTCRIRPRPTPNKSPRG